MKEKKCVWITGASRGLGAALLDEFIKRHWLVAACARNQKAIDLLKQKHGDEHYFSSLDVCVDKGVQEFCAQANTKTLAPDLLLNNAGIINRNAPLWEISDQEFSEVIDVNLKGTASVIRHVLPIMIEAKKGVIVNFSSGWGRSTAPEVAPYCASKWAIEGLSQALSQELPKGLSVLSLNPGVIDTDMLRSCWQEGASGLPSPQQWAKTAVTFLESLDQKDNGKALTVE